MCLQARCEHSDRTSLNNAHARRIFRRHSDSIKCFNSGKSELIFPPARSDIRLRHVRNTSRHRESAEVCTPLWLREHLGASTHSLGDVWSPSRLGRYFWCQYPQPRGSVPSPGGSARVPWTRAVGYGTVCGWSDPTTLTPRTVYRFSRHIQVCEYDEFSAPEYKKYERE